MLTSSIIPGCFKAICSNALIVAGLVDGVCVFIFFIRSSTAIFEPYFITEEDPGPTPTTLYICLTASAYLGSLARPPKIPVFRFPILEYIVLSFIGVPSGKPCKDKIKFLRTLLATFSASAADKPFSFINLEVIVSTARGLRISLSYSLTSTFDLSRRLFISPGISKPSPRYPRACSIPLAVRFLFTSSNSLERLEVCILSALVACAKTVSGFGRTFLFLGVAVPCSTKEAITGLFAGSCADCAGITASPPVSNAGTTSPALVRPGTLTVPFPYFRLCGPPFGMPRPNGPTNPTCAAIAFLYAKANAFTADASEVNVCLNL